VIVQIADTAFDRPPPQYQAPSFEEVIDVLNADDIEHVGILLQNHEHSMDALADMGAISDGTATLATS
jgi:hypothetical protein